MKKKILSIALVLTGLMGTTAMAQSPTTTRQQTEQTATRPAKKAKANPFEGLNLSEKQQSDLKVLNESRKTERQKKADQKKAEKKAERQAMREQNKKDKQEYLAKIKEILTPEQYVQFLENAYMTQGKRAVGGPRGGKHGMRPGKQANNDRKQQGKRGQRAAATAPAAN